MKTINRTFNVLRDIPETMKEITQPDNGLWVYASVEIVDSMGDVVVIDGINTSVYHQPPKRFMKILADHRRDPFEDGTPPIVGRVEQFVKTAVNVDGAQVPALALRISWACDGDGAITPLAKKYKDLYDGGYLDSFSVGLQVIDFTPIETGLQYDETIMFETSCVSIPANAEANVVKSIDEALGEIKSTEKAAPKSFMKSLDVMSETISTLLGDLQNLREEQAEVKKIVTETYNAHGVLEGVSSDLKGLRDELNKSSGALNDRLDLFESALVMQSEGDQPTHDRKPDHTEKLELDEVRAALKRLSKIIAK